MRSVESSAGKRIDSVLCAARRRRALTLVLEQTGIAIALVLAGAILMLVLGTQILAWYWLVLLASVGIGIGVFVLRNRWHPIPNYRLAQVIDHRLKLSDSLSTAWFLLSQFRGNDPIARFQIERAERIADSVRVGAAFPITGRRHWALSATLAAIALSLFGVRYLVTNSISLRPSLLPMQFGPVLEALEKPFTAEVNKDVNSEPSNISQFDISQQGRQLNSAKTLKQSQPPSSAAGESSAENPSTPSDADPSTAGSPTGVSADRAAAQQASGPEKTPQDAAQKSEQASTQPSSSGLLGKMKDALSSLMAKLRPNSSSAQSAHNGERATQAQTSTEQALGKDNRSTQPNAQGNSSSEQQNAAGSAQGEATERKQSAQARNASGSSEHKGSDKQSGIGRQDGAKDIREAEQLRAMGVLAEIIGKRSATLTGDMSVETSSHNQVLKTDYSQHVGHHSDSGGEIDRDEIPLAYQQYVRDYMQEVRKRQPDSSVRPPE